MKKEIGGACNTRARYEEHVQNVCGGTVQGGDPRYGWQDVLTRISDS
jgi:hypothetical protein